MRLFVLDEQPLEKLLTEIHEPSPKFTLWIRATLKRANGLQTAENILTALVESGLANDRQSGLQYLNNFCGTHSASDLVIACSDLLGKQHTQSFRKLEKSLGLHAIQQPADMARFFGIISHQAIHDLMTGKIPNYDFAQKLKDLGFETSLSVSPNLFIDSRSHTQELLFEAGDVFADIRFADEVTSVNRISDKLLGEISELQSQMLLELSQPGNPIMAFGKTKPLLKELRARLFPIFGQYINSCTRYEESGSGYFLTLTLLSWASALLFATGKNSRTLFKEIEVLSTKDIRLGGGRMDALELTTIGGNEPNGWQKKILEEMSSLHFGSSGQLILSLERKFGSNLAFRITDWKFTVGDAEKIGQIIQPDDLAQPLPKHFAQMRRYITLANLDYYLHTGKIDIENIWSDNSPIKSGTIMYFLASERPVIHNIVMTPEEQKHCFIQEVVFPYNQARRLAIVRNLNNILSGHIMGQLVARQKSVKESGATKAKRATQRNATLNLPVNSLEQIIDRHKCFTDEQNIIEWVGNKNNQPVYLMHLSRLLKAMRQKKVGGDFDPERGRGFITCLMPDHEEHTPSLHIDLGRGIWKCFGCGAYGFFADELVTDDEGNSIKIAYLRNLPKGFKKTGKVVIPDAHHKIMSLAQEVLNTRFKNSHAQDYVAVRALDPDLTHSLGAGYGDDNLINVILDSYNYDELIHYGFVAISSKVSSVGGICPLLLKRGMRLDQMKRQANTQFGLPYSPLARRVTFPLTLEGRMTNFYGRATWQCIERSKHRKLSVEHTNIPHGAFNIQVLNSDNPEVIIAEGAFDALSLIQMGHPATMAIIGVNNKAILESIARSSKNLALAFDYDHNAYQTGQTNTQKITDELKAMNYPGQVRNFTEQFIAEHPDFTEAGKDFSEYLKYTTDKTKTA